MTSNNNSVPSIKFGPNKTAKQFYCKLLLTCICLIILAILCSILLIWQCPQVQKSILSYFQPSKSSSSSSPAASLFRTEVRNDTKSTKSEAQTTSTPNATASTGKLSERNDMDPHPFNPGELHPMDDLLPSSSDRSSDVTLDDPPLPPVTASERFNENENENPNDVQGPVTKVSGLKARPVDVLRGNDIVVKTKLGKVKGIQGEVLGHQVNAFLGIPYTAEVPIGDRRFTRSIKRTQSWQGILNVQSFKPHCPQVFHDDVVDKRTILVHEFSEDCLYLNIWSPVTRSGTGGGSGSRQPIFPKVSSSGRDGGPFSASSRKKSPTAHLKPVMMWMFGGGYSGGSNNLDEMDGRMLAALGDVIVVTFNYRIGSLGFLDLGIDDAPGNMGLYDAISAIEFVKDNIASFGGDPDEMTLFGQSAGAISIGLLMTNNHTSKYFRRAILESGSPIMMNFFFNRADSSAQKFLNVLNCTEAPSNPVSVSDEIIDVENSDISYTVSETSTTSSLVDREFDERRKREVQCLRSKTVDELLAGQKSLLQVAFPFTPSPLEQLLPIMPYDAIRADPGNKMYRDTFNNFDEVLIGTNTDEASVILHLEIPQIFGTHEIKLNITTLEGLKDFLINNLSSEFSIDHQTAILFTNIFFNRGPEIDTTVNLVRKLYQVVGDLAFVCPVVAFAEGLANRGKTVYQYEFGYRSSASPWGKWMGVTHGDEYIFVFGHPLRYPERYSQEDITMSRRMIEIWTTFAKTGKVPPQMGKPWPKHTPDRGEYMKIKNGKAKIGQKMEDDVCSLFAAGLESLRRRKRNADESPDMTEQSLSAFVGKFSL